MTATNTPGGSLNILETSDAEVDARAALGKDLDVARVELIDAMNAPVLARPMYAGGDPGPIVAALANVPELLKPALGFVGAALGDGAAPARIKEIAILRTSALQGCRYCIYAHSAVALDVGLSAGEIRALRGEIALEDAFAAEAERTLIGWIDAVAGATGPVPSDAWDPARSAWPDHILVELAVTIGATMFLNRFATAFELPTAPEVLARLRREGLA